MDGSSRQRNVGIGRLHAGSNYAVRSNGYMLGLSFGTENEEDRTDDLMNAINELTARMNSMLGVEEE